MSIWKAFVIPIVLALSIVVSRSFVMCVRWVLDRFGGHQAHVREMVNKHMIEVGASTTLNGCNSVYSIITTKWCDMKCFKI